MALNGGIDPWATWQCRGYDVSYLANSRVLGADSARMAANEETAARLLAVQSAE